jgi:hypothetical protein
VVSRTIDDLIVVGEVFAMNDCEDVAEDVQRNDGTNFVY